MTRSVKSDDNAAVLAELKAMRAGLREALARIDAIEALLAPRAPEGEPPRRKRPAPPREPGTRGRRAPVLPGTRTPRPASGT